MKVLMVLLQYLLLCSSIGAGLDRKIILIMGVGNLVADAFSMGIGNYISDKSEYDYIYLFHKKIGHKKIKKTQIDHFISNY